jgi:hypothetical protein
MFFVFLVLCPISSSFWMPHWAKHGNTIAGKRRSCNARLISWCTCSSCEAWPFHWAFRGLWGPSRLNISSRSVASPRRSEISTSYDCDINIYQPYFMRYLLVEYEEAHDSTSYHQLSPAPHWPGLLTCAPKECLGTIWPDSEESPCSESPCLVW